MKKLIFILAITGATCITGAQELVKDTTVRFNQKLIQIQDSIGQVKVMVYDELHKPYSKVYEGVFSDEKSYEKWTVIEEIGFNIPFIHKTKSKSSPKMEPHWAGLGWGFLNVTDGNQLNNINGVSIQSEKANEFYFNLAEKILPIYRNNLGITTGLGFNWKTFYLDTDQYFSEVNGVTTLQNLSGSPVYYSRLRMFYITVPLLFEWQPTVGSNRKFFISAGVVGGVNTMASSKAKYKDASAVRYHKEKDLNAAPITLDAMAQIGYGSWSVYAKYSPYGIFQSQKGPEIKAVSLGATLNF